MYKFKQINWFDQVLIGFSFLYILKFNILDDIFTTTIPLLK